MPFSMCACCVLQLKTLKEKRLNYTQQKVQPMLLGVMSLEKMVRVGRYVTQFKCLAFLSTKLVFQVYSLPTVLWGHRPFHTLLGGRTTGGDTMVQLEWKAE